MHELQVVRLPTYTFNNCWSHGPSIGIRHTLKIQIAFDAGECLALQSERVSSGRCAAR